MSVPGCWEHERGQSHLFGHASLQLSQETLGMNTHMWSGGGVTQ